MYDDISHLFLDCIAASTLNCLRIASIVAIGAGNIRMYISDGCLLTVIDL